MLQIGPLRAWRDVEPAGGRAFTFVELLVVIVVLVLCVLMVLPSLARTRTNSPMIQCQNNLKQLAVAWMMYSADNQGRLVSAYPNYASFTATWCRGNAQTSGEPSVYVYGGADPAGIQMGLLWPYTKSLGVYKCPADKRIATSGLSQYIGKPILRSVAMNSYMAGTSYGVTPAFSITSPTGARNPNTPVFLKESEIARPAGIWVIVDEDPRSINDGMFLVDMGGTRGLIDLPSRLHGNSYGINFADGHTESIELVEPSSLNWSLPIQRAINNDWRSLTNLTTAPLH